MGPGSARAAVLTAYARSLISYKARQLCRKPGFSRSDEEDLVQDLTLSLLRKADQYDPSRGASLDTFADRVVISQVKMMLRARRRHKRAAGFQAASLEETDPSPLKRWGVSTPEDPTSAIDHLEAVSTAIAHLDPSDQAVARLLGLHSIQRIAKKLRTSRRQITAALERIRLRCEEAGLGNK